MANKKYIGILTFLYSRALLVWAMGYRL